MKYYTVDKLAFYSEVAERLNLFPEDIQEICECIQGTAIDYLMLSNEYLGFRVQFTDDVQLTSDYIKPKLEPVINSDPIIVDESLEFGVRLTPDFKKERIEDFQQRRMIKDLMASYEKKE